MSNCCVNDEIDDDGDHDHIDPEYHVDENLVHDHVHHDENL